MKRIILIAALLTCIFAPAQAADRYLLYFAERPLTATVEGVDVTYYEVGPKNLQANKVLKVVAGVLGTPYDIIAYATNRTDHIRAARKIDSFLGCGTSEIAARAANGIGAGGYTAAQLLQAYNAIMRVSWEGPDLDENAALVYHHAEMNISEYIAAGAPGTLMGISPPLEIYGAEIND